MDSALQMLLFLTGGVIVLQLFGHLTSFGARKRAEQLEMAENLRLRSYLNDDGFRNQSPDKTDGLHPSDGVSHESPASGQHNLIPDEETSGLWWRKLLTAQGMRGMLLLFVEVPVLLINSYILSLRFEVLFSSPGQPLFTMMFLGWYREVTDYDLFGMLISLMQMSTSAIAWGIVTSNTHRRLSLSALIAWVGLVILEVGVSIYSGLLVDGTFWNAILSGLMAFAIAMVEGLFGVFVIDFFIIPLLLAVSWTIASPIRAIALGLQSRKVLKRRKALLKKQFVPTFNPVYSILGAIDEVVFKPLRELDETISRKIKEIFKRKHPQLEQA